ncbi:hypothetical protein C0989_001345 [Termitomyces sp. Mn162]|nr:hypothetical protein C0989_001345 [Termitomyces sp. Mn162]
MLPPSRTLSSPPPKQFQHTGDTEKLTTSSDFKTILASNSGPILAAKLYDCIKLTSILATTALTSNQAKLKSTILAVTFLMEADVYNQVLNVLANIVAAKALGKLNSMVGKLSSIAEFLNANNAQRAETTLAIKYMSKMLAKVTSLLDTMASKLAKSPAQPDSTSIWMTIARASMDVPASLPVGLASSTSSPSLLLANNQTQVQQ